MGIYESTFTKIFEIYKSSKDIDLKDIENSIYSCLGGTLEWLKFNLERVIQNNSKEESEIAQNQVHVSIKTIIERIKDKDRMIGLVNSL